MRQTIECWDCGGPDPDRFGTTEHKSTTPGFLLFPMICDDCGKELEPCHLVAAVGIWDEGKRIYNIPGWQWQYIKQATQADITRHEKARQSARELANDPV